MSADDVRRSLDEQAISGCDLNRKHLEQNEEQSCSCITVANEQQQQQVCCCDIAEENQVMAEKQQLESNGSRSHAINCDSSEGRELQWVVCCSSDDKSRDLKVPQSDQTYDDEHHLNGAARHRLQQQRKNSGINVIPAEINENVLPIHKLGIVSLMTFHWITGFMWRVYKKGTTSFDEMWKCCPEESTEVNGERLLQLWHDEVSRKGLQCASVGLVVARFIRNQFLIAVAVNILNGIFTFIGPALLFRLILDYANSPESNIVYGVALAVILFLTENGRTWTLMMQMQIGYILAVRARAAMMYLVYDKILKLRSFKDKSAGELINFFANDCQRLHELMYLLPMILSGPLIAIATTIYCVYYIGPWAFVGSGVILLYYPYQYVISRLTLYVRRIAIRITDKRVRIMTEILTCIKLIKLYAWENSFARSVAAIRAKERQYLQRAAYLQTLSIAFTPLMPVFAAVCTFTAHILTGNKLTISQAFVIISVYNITRMKVSMLPYIARIWAETTVGFNRAKTILIMEEIDSERYSSKPSEPDLAVQMLNGTFAWDTVNQPTDASHEKTKCGKRKVSHRGDGTAGSQNGVKTSDTQRTQRRQFVIRSKNLSKSTATQKNGDTRKRKVDDNCNGDSGMNGLLSATLSEDEFTDVLFDINFSVPKGKLYGICGSIGSGKSSLIAAILGQMYAHSGSVAVNGRLCYVPQQAWLLNATLRENILFGLPYNKQRYDDVIEQCNLKPDMRVLPAGDMTEIGERGINLSGGQKQRVSLARAVYSDRDIFLLDDPLSAVDAHVGRHLFERCIQPAAASGKTVVFVTHQMQYLAQCHKIFVMKDGRVIENGTHDELMSSGGDYAALIKLFYERPEKDSEAQEAERKPSEFECLARSLSVTSAADSLGSRTSLQRMASLSGRLIEEEQVEKGAVTLSTYRNYCLAAGGYFLTAVVIISFMVPVACASFTDWWLSYWLSRNSSSPADSNSTDSVSVHTVGHDLHFYALIYGLLAVAVVVTSCIRGIVYMTATLRASSRMHNQVFHKILHCPMAFFDVTPVGRLLNRFSKDLDEVDVRLPFSCEELMQNLCFVLAAICMIALSFPWFLLAMVIPAVIFLFLQRIARVVMREVKRIDNVTRSPLFSHVAATVQGLHTIRSYNKETEFVEKLKTDIDRNSTATLHFYFAMRWLGIRLDILATIITLVVATVVVVAKGDIAQSYAALALTYSAKLTGLFQYTIRLASEAEARFTSVERIHYYMTNVEEEAASVVAGHRPAASWPSEGEIKYNNYCLRYRQSLPLVLRNITCHIKAREKIGVVGRTGSGKSSLVAALFRLTEPVSGTLTIDDIDISTIGLQDLRTMLSIIPQDPVLFVGSIRYNLDPFNEHSVDDIWLSLEKCHINELILKLPGGLETPVVENGENFSVGERQLLCLARALLRKSKILILDEATAAVDTRMDAMIQTTIAEAFVDCTMLVIAHRLNTVLHCDRILVLDAGKIVEFDSPSSLLQNPKSLFASMLRRTEYNANSSAQQTQ